jgi:glycosyltransferase involved in cell wall biosynthesis
MTADAVGGVWQYTVDLVRCLSESGAEVLVAVLGPAPSDEQRDELRTLRGVALAEGSFALEWEPNSWANVDASGEWLLELDTQFNADLVHLNGYSHASLRWRKPVIVVAHSCVYSWWRNVLNCPPDSEWAEYKRRVTAGLLACDKIVAPSRFMAAEIGREYGASAEKIRVIHNFSSRKPAGINEKQPFFFAAGRVWDPAKNFGLLEQVAPYLSWPVRLAGKDRSEATSAGGLQKLGHIPSADLLDLMAKASVFVHPALYEPFGLSVLDAARARCCLVLADTPSLRELWAEAAILLDPRDPNAWIDELNSLSRDLPRCRELGDRAFAHAGRYTAESTAHAYQSLYAELISRGRKRAEEAA